MKLVIDIPQGMIDAFSHEVEWTRVLCRDMNTVLQKGTPIEERPKGKWIQREDMNYLDENKIIHEHFMCEKCGLIHDFIDGHTSQYNFCPNCGADMRGDV